MPRYTYQAYDRHGALNAGVIEAQSRKTALDALHRQGQYPLQIDESAASAVAPWWRRELFAGSELPLADLGNFTREMATLIKADLPLDEVLRIVSLQPLVSNRMRGIATLVFNRVREGMSLSGALAEDRRFPEYYWRLVLAGEASGSLGNVLDELCLLLDRSIEVRRQITSALLYPLTLLIAAGATVVVIVTVLLPTIVPMFKDAGAQLPASVQFMVDVRDLLENHSIAMLLLLAMLSTGVVAVGRDQRLKRYRDGMLLRLPVLGSLVRDRETGRFARTLSTLMHSGVPMLDAVRITASVLQNRAFAEAVVEAGDSIKEGRALSAPLIKSGLFTELAVRLIGVGEQTGQLSTMLMQVAKIYEATLERQLTRLMSLVTPILTLLIGGLVGGLILSVMNAILSVNDLAFK